MKRAGPELKLPDLKQVRVPKFASDLYYDLYDRRLLPLVALILVAIVAMPFLLGGGSKTEQVGAPPAEIGGGAQASSLTVVEAQPGLRDYRQRLSGRTPTDPFKQRFTGAAGGTGLPNKDSGMTSADGSGGPAEPSSGAPSESSPPPSSSAPIEPAPTPKESAPSGGGKDTDSDEIPKGVNLYTYVLDVQITRIQKKLDGRVEKVGPKLHKDVKAPAPLPGGKAPVLTYLGMGSKKPRLPMFLISPDVTAIYGEAECISGTDSCQLIALEKGFPVTFVYGENDVRYKINLVGVEPVAVRLPSS